MFQKIKSLFFPEWFLESNLRDSWKRTHRENYIFSTNQFLPYLALLLVIHLFLVDIPSGFQPRSLFIEVRLSLGILAVLVCFVGSRLKTSALYKLPYILFFTWLSVGQLVLMHSEPSIPFFVALVFLILPPIFMGLSFGFSLVAATLIFIGSIPMLEGILPTSSVPVNQQLVSNYLMVAFAVCGFRSVIFKDIRIFHLNENNLRLKAELAQGERLISLGTFAAGMAHEINNTIFSISAASGAMNKLIDGLKIESESKAKLSKYSNVIKVGVELTTHIIQSLSNYTGLNKSKVAQIEIEKVVETALTLVKGGLPSNVEVIIEIDPGLKVVGNPVSFHQIFMNLITNAIDALPQGGKLRISARQIQEMCELSVVDTGTGIADNIKGRIFDPFFTTKEVGKGTGLGLYIVDGEVRKHKGTVAVESSSAGTKFTIRVPLDAKLPE